MAKSFFQIAEKLNKEHKRSKRWHKVITVMAAVVVFCTTYALILPAITWERSLMCDMKEHTHTDACYSQVETVAERQELICTKAEHTHTDACYEEIERCVCGLEEDENHQHTADCMEVERVLVCEQAEHNHDGDCYQTISAETERQLTCGKTEHIHTDACYDAPPAYDSGYYCGHVAHKHNEHCYNDDGTLRCTMSEHEHTLACQIKADADVETAADWEATFADVKLTGNRGEDVLAIAETQIGYTESAKNYVIDNEKTGEVRGYSRYGDWFGNPYGDWCAMFCAFCLDYAGVDNMPVDANCQTWIEKLDKEGLYHEVGSYDPKPGDLVFYCWDKPEVGKDRCGDHVGFVYEVVEAVEATETTEAVPAKLRTIEGNWSNSVCQLDRELNSDDIIGYGELPGAFTKTFNGDDFTVVAKYDTTAKIPANAQLIAEKIPADSELYQQYYQQSVEAMLDNGYASSEEELAISYLQFYDISFFADGEEIEPEGPVDIAITSKEGKLSTEDNSTAIHFGDKGTEILAADADISGTKDPETTFSFTQDSFSVTGVMLTAPSVVTTYTRTPVYSLNDMNGKSGAIVCTINWKPGAMQDHVQSNGTLERKSVSFSSDDITDSDLTIWTLEKSPYSDTVRLRSGNYYLKMNNGVYSLGGQWDNGTIFYVNFVSDGSFYLSGDPRFNSTTRDVNSSGSSLSFITYNGGDPLWLYIPTGSSGGNGIVWLDGTDGGAMNLYGSPNENYSSHLTDNRDGTYSLVLPTTWPSPSKYNYALSGWYDVYAHTYYAPGETATVYGNTVFYADWRAATYDVGQNNSHVIPDADTSSFITTEVYDYSAMFNVMSTTVSGNISSTGHSENWAQQEGGVNGFTGESPLDFMFIDYDWGTKLVSYNGKDDNNTNHSYITPGILDHIREISGKNLLELLFNPSSNFDPVTGDGVVGVSYIGQGDQLFHYMEEGQSNYDGEHNGYYYYDSKLNAASYNKTDGRFYVYDYLERTSDSDKDGGVGEYSDFLPFNSPYANNNGHTVLNYDYNGTTNYQYDAKNNGENSAYANAITNYFFGIHTDVQFYLPNDSGFKDAKGNYGNQSIKGDDMVFEFAGDDDVWIFVDDELLLDIGGLHGVRSGNINFSTGEVTVYNSGDTPTTRTVNFTSGEHKLRIYYMERGSSQANCSIYFNLPPRFKLNLNKEDAFTAEALNGAEFAFYTDAACTQPAHLWHNESEYRTAYAQGGESAANAASTNTFTILNGTTSCWGLAAGQTYYLKETRTPDGAYVTAYDTVCVSLDARGGAEYKASRIDGGPNGSGDGEEDVNVKGFDVDSQTKTLDMTVTNRQAGTKELTVTKQWASGSSNIPNSVTVRLLQNGVPIGDTVTLRKSENWKHTWLGLPGTDENDVAYEYSIEEYPVPAGYVSSGQWTDHEGDNIAYRLTNTPIPEDNLTSVEVTKTWNDGAATNHPSVTFHLYADGKDTGRTLTLPISGNWTGTLEGLPLKDSGGHTIEYTVVEDAMAGYSPIYADVTSEVHMVTPPSSGAVGTWKTVNVSNASVMEVGGIYRFTYNGYAMADVDDNAKPGGKAINASDTSQRWEVVNKSSSGSDAAVVLKNVDTGRYLYHGDNVNVWTLDTRNSIASFNVRNNRLHWGFYSPYWSQELEVDVDNWGNINPVAGTGTQFTIEKLNTVAPEPVPADQYYAATVTNNKVDVISVQVDKTWSNGNNTHAGDSVTVHLYADGVDTGKALTLNAANNWRGTFADLNKEAYSKDGHHTIVYTITEDFVEGYDSDVKSTQNARGDYTVHVTNSPEEYALPESGGIGVVPIYTLGAMLIAGAFVCGYFLRRKAERRHR